MRYRLEYRGVHCKFYPTRDAALAGMMNAIDAGYAAEDFEILDGSDEL